MSNLIPYNFNGDQVRVIMMNNDPWFIAEDVCSTLNLKNPTMSLKALDIDERSKFNLGRQGEVNIINESGLFTLTLRCRDAVKEGTKPYRFRKCSNTRPMLCFATSLTWEGHEFLDKVREQTAWSRIKQLIREKGLDLSYNTIKVVMSTVVANML